MRNLISQSLKTVALGLAVSVASALTGQAAITGTKTLPGHVPSVVSHLTAVKDLSGETNLQLSLGLPLRNREALTNLLQDIYDPTSPNYHHFLTSDAFTAQFGPTAQDYQAVIDFARKNGLQVVGTHRNRMLVDVSGKASDIEQAFQVKFHKYHHPTEGRDFYASDVDPSIPANLPIQDIGGLDNLRSPHTRLKVKPNSTRPVSMDTVAAPKSNVSPAATTGSGPLGNYIGNDFRNAYVPGTSLNGSGQTIALVQFDGYLASDISIYEGLAGRTNIPLQNVLLDGFSGAPTGNGGEVEVSLDIEMCISMAPALSKIILYEGDPFNFHPNDVLNAIAADNSARQISCSWGWGGGPDAFTTDQIFQEMAVQGQTFYDAVGDSCAFTPGANSVNGVDNPFLPNAPSDSPYITQVGGTTLTMSGLGVAYSSETVWNWGTRYGPFEDGVGSSGGISSFYQIPSWQTNVSMAFNQGSTTFRNMPDVALTADDVLVVADGGLEYIGVGGTSCASPLWAGFTALINQQATNASLPSVGFINPALYALASSTNYTNCFHDITTGNNEWSQSPTMFSAVTGYDLCTGLGTPNGTNLINSLLFIATNFTVTHVSPPPKPYGPTLSVLNGSNPNGTWSLFVQDDTQPDSGEITNGWILTLVTANPVGYAADAGVTMSASTGSAAPGANFNYFITVTNYGPSISTNVLVTDNLPDGLTVVSNNPSLGYVIRNGSTLIWNAGILTPGTGGQLTLTAQSSTIGAVVNSVLLNSDTPDPNPSDDTASATVNIGTLTAPSLSGSLVNVSHGFQFAVNSLPGMTNVVQVSTNLSNPLGWTAIYTNVGSFLFMDSSATNYKARFYRDVMLTH